MVNADDGQWDGVLVIVNLDGDCGVFECSVDAVNGERVVWVCGVAGDVNDDAEVAAGLGQEVVVDKGRDWVGKIDLEFQAISLGLLSPK